MKRDASDFRSVAFIEFLFIGIRVIDNGNSGCKVDKESIGIREIIIIGVRVIMFIVKILGEVGLE
jgi:hypothetical protein